MKNWLVVVRLKVCILAWLLSGADAAAKPGPKPLIVYTYDSFSGKGGLGPLLKEKFKAKYNAEVTFVPFATSGEALNQIAIEAKKSRADVVVGVDNGNLFRARKLGLFRRQEAKLAARVPKELQFDDELAFLPFDYGYLAFVYDSARTTPPAGVSLRDFAKAKELHKKVVIEHPRSSSLGLGLLLWSQALFPGAEWKNFWTDFSDKLVSITPGWSSAYGLFLKKEADYVLSYTTSPAYHIENEKTHLIKALLFPEGQYRQIEGVGILASSKHATLANQFVELLLSDEIQGKIATTQWMYPVAEVALPESFKALPQIAKSIELPSEKIESSKEAWLREWTALMAKPR